MIFPIFGDLGINLTKIYLSFNAKPPATIYQYKCIIVFVNWSRGRDIMLIESFNMFSYVIII